jgi:hypothetical protein
MVLCYAAGYAALGAGVMMVSRALVRVGLAGMLELAGTSRRDDARAAARGLPAISSAPSLRSRRGMAKAEAVAAA